MTPLTTVLLLILGGLSFGNANDPCQTASTLEFLKQRLVGYKLEANESPLCDYYMDEGWYSMGTNVIASSQNKCGTTYNIYMTAGTLPTDDQIGRIDICQNNGAGNTCADRKTINVKRCEMDKYVFELVSPNGCPAAYCIESLLDDDPNVPPPDISTVKPNIEVAVVKPTDINELNFYCDISPPQGTDYIYSVEWGISSGLAWMQTIQKFNPSRYKSQTEFRKHTALTENMLKNKGFGLGIRIACSVSAQHTDVSESSPHILSPSKFIGIEVLNKTIRIKDGSEETIFLRLTVPFGCPEGETVCTLDLNMYIPKNKDSCQIAEAAEIQGIKNRCGLSFENTDVGKMKPFRLTSRAPKNRQLIGTNYNVVLTAQATVIHHPFFNRYVLDTIRAEVWNDMTILSNRLCYSYNDPHMGSFDGLDYENQNLGKFVLYRNTKRETQVQVQTTQCATNIFCNCGVAISSGRDVIIVDNCGNGNQVKWWINFRLCEDRVLKNKLKRTGASQYEVHLPTGALVTIRLYQHLLNVDIVPGLSDYMNTEGLCGPFDKNTGNDRQKRPGSPETDPNLSWRVLPEEDLFSSKNDKNLKPWTEEKFICSCAAGPGNEVENQATCTAEQARTCTEDKTKPVPGHCSISRKKRNAHGMYVSRDFDHHQTVETNFNSTRSLNYKHIVKTSIQKRKVYDYNTAKTDCLDIFNTTVYRTCTENERITTSEFLDNCILDAQMTNTMDWTLLHLESLKSKCIHEADANKPLPLNILDDSQIVVNDKILDFNGTDGESVLAEIPTFAPGFLETIESVSCPYECNGNGDCKNGACVCFHPYIGDDCSVDSRNPPVMVGIPDRGECDLQMRECARTSVYGYNIAETENLSCRLVPLKINIAGEAVTDTAFTSKGELFSFVEVSCPLEPVRKRRSAGDGIDYLAQGYKVSISNDGRQFSEEDTIVIFDSECVTCTKENNNILCKKKLGYCVKYGQCYRFGETFGCKECVGGMDNNFDWISSRDCPMPVEPTPEKQLWIIPAVLVPVAVTLIVAIGCYLYQSKRIQISKKVTNIDDIRG